MASPVLVNMSAVLGLVVSLAYCLGDSESLILSSRVTSMSWQQWTTFLGQLQSIFLFPMTVKLSPGLSLSGLLAFTTAVKSLQLVSPNLVSSLRCVELVLAFGVQSLITMEAPSLLSCLGAGLINLGVIILAFHVSSDVNKLIRFNAEHVLQAKFGELEDELIRYIKNIRRPSYEDMESGRLLGGDP